MSDLFKLMRDYHDREFGTPLHDDRKIFEFLVLEGMTASRRKGQDGV